MKTKSLGFLLALTFVVFVAGVSLTEFDYSVFKNNNQFEFDVEIDVMYNNGKVSIPDGFKPIDTTGIAGDIYGGHLLMIMPDIVWLPVAAVAIRIQSIVIGWPDIENFIFMPDKTRYTIKAVNRQESLGPAKHEGVTIVITPGLMPVLDEIIKDQITSVNFRLDDDDDIEGEMAINVEQLEILMALYKEAGTWSKTSIYQKRLSLSPSQPYKMHIDKI